MKHNYFHVIVQNSYSNASVLYPIYSINFKKIVFYNQHNLFG